MQWIVDGVYLAVAVLFIVGLKAMSSPAKARRGITWAARNSESSVSSASPVGIGNTATARCASDSLAGAREGGQCC